MATALVATAGLVVSACSGGTDDSTGLAESDGDVAYEGDVAFDAPATTLAAGGTDVPNDEPYDLTFFENYGVNPRIDTEDDPRSTFALDVDTGSYTLARAWIRDGNAPDRDSVRVEEYVNYFDQGYEAPVDEPFTIDVDGGPTPFMENDRYQLVRVGVASRVVADEDRPDARLTFVIDVSGSMAEELPKVRQALGVLVRELRPTDEVAIVVYGSDSRVLLEHTPLADGARVLDAIDRLEVDGSTNAEEGLRIGYREATAAFVDGAVNRVVLASDGVANVGNTGSDSILATIAEHARDGIDLVTLGFGLGNYNDVLMEQLADDGDGFYAYVDTAREAERLFRHDLTGTLVTVARDAKVQVTFDPAAVERYRLVGFENRAVADDEFRDETVDAGEIGAGHTVTALYEVKLADTSAEAVAHGADATDTGAAADVPVVSRPPTEAVPVGALGTVALRWEDPDTGEVTETSRTILRSDLAPTYEQTSPHFQLASTVGAWAELLRGSYFAVENDVITAAAVAEEAARLANGPFVEQPDVVELAELTRDAVELGG
ncbi:MAG: von Willebrand factor type A domain-containing protein [Actinomycetota bacterium]|nr:von Willebrand factor type A domain-containing protein [Actinomycetota bacterium]